MNESTVDPRPIFVCGVGRSGTSLLQSMLNAHPQICFTPETHFFRRYVAHDRTKRCHERRGILKFIEQLEADAEFARAKIPAKELLPEFEQPLKLEAAYKSLLVKYSQVAGKPIVGDKDPRNIDFIEPLRRHFPNSVLLHIIRDPRDVILSRTKAKWSSGRPWWMHALIYRAQFRRGQRDGNRYFGDDYIEVHYEDLIQSPQEILTKICGALSVKFDKSMLSFAASATRLVDPAELSWKSETIGPLLQDNSGKWQAELSNWQVQVIERVCEDAFRSKKYKYSSERRPLSIT
ncbi:MAG: hypothetical protein ACI9HK_006311, partial [Pirellulaceae bacterium]